MRPCDHRPQQVTLFTKRGTALVVDGVFCKQCAEEDEEDLEAGQTLAESAALLSDAGTVEPAPATHCILTPLEVGDTV